jgi:diguanylate cyclase (GGDEF)-like protein
MPRKADVTEHLGLEARFKAELARLEARNSQTRWISFLALALLIAGVGALLWRESFWRQESVEIRIPPPVLFVLLVLLILLVLYLLRRELEIRKLSLLSLQERQATESERSAGMIDAVTHVFNRRFLRDLLQGEIARAERNRRPLMLVMCDLDHFKQVNDRYGHLVGDEILAHTASILKSCVRGSDYVVRYGGDEFLLILSETDEPGAGRVLARIREKMGESERIQEVGMSLSIGLWLHQAGLTADQDIAAVDARFYADKQGVQAGSGAE